MNNDLISRTELLNKISGLICYEQRRSGTFETRCEAGLLVAKELAKSAPAVDAEPVRHGRWEWDEIDFTYTCSECKCDFDYSSMYGLFDHGFAYAGYCPNCGARMEAEVNDHGCDSTEQSR